jgi:hypothetical protein
MIALPPLYCHCTALHRLYIATGQEQYKKAAYDYYMKHYKDEDGPGVWDNFDWDSNSWAAVVLLQRYVAALGFCFLAETDGTETAQRCTFNQLSPPAAPAPPLPPPPSL